LRAFWTNETFESKLAPTNRSVPRQGGNVIEDLGRYKILEEIGQGGFAIVYRASDTELDRLVALKELRQGPLHDSEWVKRFKREARTIARLNHPRIVTIHDVLEVAERLFIVMRLVDGPSLDQLIASQGRLSWAQTGQILTTMAEALDYAHAQGILHRDLKPANILLDSERGPQLSDFGLAKLVSEASSSVTAAGGIVGTPHYIAPEVWDGQGTTPQSDLYALGCILYEMLIGEKLFPGETPPAVMMAHFRPLMLPNTWPEGVPSDATPILKIALAKKPDQRYTTAGELATALTRLAEAEFQSAILAEQMPTGEALAQPGDEEASLVPVAPPGPGHNLPAQATPFIGREAELAELKDRLQDPACRLLTLIGPGGSGKTRLALEAAAAQVDNFVHGVYFVRLAPLESPDTIVATVAEALNFTFYEGSTPQQQLLDYLRQKTMLLVMDNFEHLLSPLPPPPGGAIRGGASPEPGRRDSVGLLTDILKTAPDVRILATSRAKLNVQGEQLLPIAGMEFPDWETPEDAAPAKDVAQYSGVKLFLQSAHRVRPDFELTVDNLADVIQICRLVQGMPLGIELAAAWMEMLSPVEIAVEISQSLDFLETDLHDVPARQRSMRAVFDHSWNLLTERERAVFQGLSVFRGGFTVQAAQEVTGASLRGLMALVNKSLLHRASTGRYEVHELLRQYGAEKLDQEPTVSEAVRNRHCAYYCAALQQREADLKGVGQQAALAEIEADSENGRVAWDWALAQGQLEPLEQALDSLGYFYERRGRYQEGEAVCRVAAEKLTATESGNGQRVLAKVLTWQANFNRILGRTELASQLLRHSLALLDSPALADQDTRPEKAFVLILMGYIAFDSDPEEARRLYERSLALYQALSDRWGVANALHVLGGIASSSSAFGEAERLFEESLAIRQTLGDQWGIANSLSELAYCALPQGQVEEGERLARESLAVLQEIGDRTSLAYGLMHSGRALIWAGQYAEGHSLLEESLPIYNDLGARSEVALSQAWLGYAQCHLGEYDQARRQIQKGLTLYREIGRKEEPIALWFLGQALLALEAYAEVQRLLQESVTRFRESGSQAEVGLVLGTLGHTQYRLGNISQAQQHLSEALRIANRIRVFSPLHAALPVIALLLADQGDVERAVELYALVSHYPAVANSRWFYDTTGWHIAAVASTLPPDVFAAAQERGKARDLWTTTEELLVELGQT
jgi:predicted ATPase/tRNA A-37 threonylcarbamoyl transferase component Bud32